MAQLAVTVSRVGAAVTAWKALPASTVGTAEPGRPEHGGRRKSAGAAWQAGVPPCIVHVYRHRRAEDDLLRPGVHLHLRDDRTGRTVMTTPDPPLDELADEADELGWDREHHGRMRDQDADDDAVPTEPWRPS